MYLLNLERTAALNDLPVDHWMTLLSTQMTGKAQKVFTELTIEDSTNYSVLKEHLLSAFDVVPEVYRRRFRCLHKDNAEIY